MLEQAGGCREQLVRLTTELQLLTTELKRVGGEGKPVDIIPPTSR